MVLLALKLPIPATDPRGTTSPYVLCCFQRGLENKYGGQVRSAAPRQLQQRPVWSKAVENWPLSSAMAETSPYPVCYRAVLGNNKPGESYTTGIIDIRCFFDLQYLPENLEAFICLKI